jgi:agmatine deiminase
VAVARKTAARGSKPAALEGLPNALGYRMPAEWDRHRATWLAWPHNTSDWPGKFSSILWVYAEIVRHLTRGERVCLLVQDAALEKRARAILSKAQVSLDRVDFHRVATDRAWLRDSGPTFVTTQAGARAAVGWRFNAWAKYSDWKRDVHVPTRIAAIASVPLHTPRPSPKGPAMVMEGGALDTDGQGTLLATEECLLSDVQARNPGLGRADLEQAFADSLGIRKVVWLGRGIVGDDTHGHVDDLARFVAPGRVVLVAESDPHDDNYRALHENRERLQGARDASGNQLEVIPLAMPAPVVFAGRRLPASYANFYIANDRVLCPTFNDVRDRDALGILSELFPTREVVGIHAVDLVWGLGTLHCMTQQEPAPR